MIDTVSQTRGASASAAGDFAFLLAALRCNITVSVDAKLLW